MTRFHIVVMLAGATLAPAARATALASFAPVPLQQADAADAVYGRARRALDDKNYDAAARLFESILASYPRSAHAPDALYWKGFALYRNGNLDGAAAALESQAARFPNAATRSDGSTLLILIKGEQAKRGNSSARRDVDSAAGAVQTDASCKDMELRIAALDALQQMDSDRVLPLLRRVMQRREACAEQLRKNALFILAQKGGEERDKLLLDIARGDPSKSVRNDAVFYLGQTNGSAAVDALEDILLRGDETAVRSNALFALAQIHTERTTKLLQTFAMMDGAPTSLRNDALFHIAQENSAATNKWLASVIVNSKAPMELRKNALFHLAQKADASDDFVGAFDASLPTEIRKDMLFHIAQRKDDKSLLKLISIAKSDPNLEIRKDALFFVAQSKDPRALKALEELVVP